MDGGIEPQEGLGIALGSRVEHHFTKRIYDFNKNLVVTTGYFESAEYETTYQVSFKILKNKYNFIEIEYTNNWDAYTKEKLHKTLGCYYLKDPMGFKEYYCENRE